MSEVVKDEVQVDYDIDQDGDHAVMNSQITVPGYKEPVKVVMRYHRQHGLHCTEGDAPAMDQVSEFGRIRIWAQQDQNHRSQGRPAIVFEEPDGEVIVEQYYEEGLLHREDGPAVDVALENGERLTQYHWRGVRMEEWHILEKEKITLDTVLNERNTEVRRAMIEIAGAEKIFEENSDRIRVVDENHDEISGDYESLLEISGDEENRYLMVRCPSKGSVYHLAVGNAATCHEAQTYLSSGLNARTIDHG